jgi:hypothetical protein
MVPMVPIIMLHGNLSVDWAILGTSTDHHLWEMSASKTSSFSIIRVFSMKSFASKFLVINSMCSLQSMLGGSILALYSLHWNEKILNWSVYWQSIVFIGIRQRQTGLTYQAGYFVFNFVDGVTFKFTGIPVWNYGQKPQLGQLSKHGEKRTPNLNNPLLESTLTDWMDTTVCGWCKYRGEWKSGRWLLAGGMV